MQDILATFKALTDRTRIRIMGVLIRANKALCVCEIIDALELPQYAVSKHVRELKISGLVQEEKIGKFVFYSLPEKMDDFHRQLITALKVPLVGSFPEDIKRLKKRLALRENGQCVIGMKAKGRQLC